MYIYMYISWVLPFSAEQAHRPAPEASPDRHCVSYSEVISSLALLVLILTPEEHIATLERCVLLYWYKSTGFTGTKAHINTETWGALEMDAALRSNAVFLLGAYCYTYLLLVEQYTLDSSLYHSEFAELTTESLLMSILPWRMLTYADVCWRMLTYVDRPLLVFESMGRSIFQWLPRRLLHR
jgi:hypothetical protein